MKKGKFSILAGIAILSVPAFVGLYNFSSAPVYQPRNASSGVKTEGIRGAIEWLASVRANQNTHDIDVADVIEAYRQADQIKFLRTSSALNLSWNEMGPENQGGRTRSILFDKTDPTRNRMYAGSVSGGLWISHNMAASWSPVNDTLSNLAISCLTQASNGDIYAGTGENLYFILGTGSGGIKGQGIWKWSAGAPSAGFVRLPKTWETATVAEQGAYSAVNQLASDPVNPLRIYAATAKGLRATDDGGATWYIPKTDLGVELPQSDTKDVDVASDGSVFARVGSVLYRSVQGGNTGTFERINSLQAGSGRSEFAISPDDPNYIYCSAARSSDGRLYNIYRSTDKGNTWTIIGPGGSTSFQPFSNALQGQGDYDNAIIVVPGNKDRIFLGGVQLWSWAASDGWNRVGSEAAFPQNPYYVHADKHTFAFHPTNNNIMFIGHDGGITRSQDAQQTFPTFQTLNKGYITTQFYSVAYKINGEVMGGTQDNGTQLINFLGNTPRSAFRILGGDGGFSEFSFINSSALFAATPNGDLVRSSNSGESFSNFYDNHIAPPTGPQPGDSSNFADFVTPFQIWEHTNDPLSKDSVAFTASPMLEVVGTGNGTVASFSGMLIPSQQSANIVPGGVTFLSGNMLVTDNGSGGLVGNVSAGGTHTINYSTGAFSFTFSAPPAQGDLVRSQYDVGYNSGAAVTVISEVNNTPFLATLPSAVAPNGSVMVKDIFQAKFAVGLMGTVWITKQVLDFSKAPNWLKVANVNGVVKAVAWSGNGDHLFVGAANRLYRISGISNVRNNQDTSGTNWNLVLGTQVTSTQIMTFAQTITGIGTDPNNPDHIVVTLGNYGNQAYVYRSTNALSATPTLTSIQNNLPKLPVFGAVIEKSNPARIILATDLGVFGSDNSGATWTEQNNGMARVATFAIRQQTHQISGYVHNTGKLYIGTHGRGIFSADNFHIPVSADNNLPPIESKKDAIGSVKVFPNPVSGSELNVSFSLAKQTELNVSVYNIQGKLIQRFELGKKNSGSHTVSLNKSEYKAGTYFLSISGQGVKSSAKFIALN